MSPFPYELTFSDVDDAFVLPQGDGAESFGTKPGSYGDWLTPLSNNGEADLGEIVVTGVRPNPTTPGGWYNSDNDGSWDGHDTSEPWLQDPPPEELPDCVSHIPANIDEDALMKVIAHLTNELRGVYNVIPGNIQIDSSRFELRGAHIRTKRPDRIRRYYDQ